MKIAAQNFFLTTIQKALNKYLALDPESAARLAVLEGKVVTLKLLAIDMSFNLVFANNAIQLHSGTALNSDTTIEGTPFRLLHLAMNRKNRQQFFSDDVSIQGNLELGQLVIDLFDQMEIDWEELLSRVIGDVPSHQIGNIVTKLSGWLLGTKDSLLRNVSEYVQEEAGFFPTREALQDFYTDVDALRMDTDRLEARVNQLQKIVEAKRSTS
jgi:ubiquinone biosynthesis protein UbiJ